MDISGGNFSLLLPMLPQLHLPRNLLAAGIVLAAVQGLVAAPTWQEMNAALGIELWQDESLWDDPADATAQRIGWPQESLTSTDSSYRSYPDAAARLLGARPYSLALYGEGGNMARLSMIFANKGDSVPTDLVAGDARPSRKSGKGYEDAIRADAKTIETTLTALLGPPVADRFGQGRETRESVKRWDWQGHAILLAAPREEYVAVRILPTDLADLGGRSRVPDAEMRTRVAARVETRPNGDVILRDIPMVDQGPKGYCVPATWERVLRYMGVPADMYVLAMAADTGAGGGTSLAGIVAGAREAVTRAGRRLENSRGKVSIREVKKAIDRGLPIMWTMYSMDGVNAEITRRTAERASATDPVAWASRLEAPRKAARKIETNALDAHMCMITGYNEKTGEIAVSDSWGPAYAERWMTVEEAEAVSQGAFTVVNF